MDSDYADPGPRQRPRQVGHIVAETALSVRVNPTLARPTESRPTS